VGAFVKTLLFLCFDHFYVALFLPGTVWQSDWQQSWCEGKNAVKMGWQSQQSIRFAGL